MREPAVKAGYSCHDFLQKIRNHPYNRKIYAMILRKKSIFGKYRRHTLLAVCSGVRRKEGESRWRSGTFF